MASVVQGSIRGKNMHWKYKKKYASMVLQDI